MALFEEIAKPLHLYFIITTLLSFEPESPKDPVWNLISLLLVLLLKVAINIFMDIETRKMDLISNSAEVYTYSYNLLSYV